MSFIAHNALAHRQNGAGTPTRAAICRASSSEISSTGSPSCIRAAAWDGKTRTERRTRQTMNKVVGVVETAMANVAIALTNGKPTGASMDGEEGGEEDGKED